MKIGIIKAASSFGRFVANEALDRGFEVSAISDDVSELPEGWPLIDRDVLELSFKDIEQFDVVVNCSEVRAGQGEMAVSVMDHLIDIFAGSSTRLMVVGSGVNLFADDSRKQKVADFLPAMKEQSDLLAQAWGNLQASSGFDWTYLAPPFHFDISGPKTGSYRTGSDFVIVDQKGAAAISYADLALALVDEISEPQFLNSMFTATYR
ncbi:NAD(P)-dependent oxidoreductase [Companilactobacillus furfuricola]|uniref:NAD(P)-dependent oxidoreductase n=1 Tax=Companilactobacillus furfuricola TaxID=1462575 RepID=UPI000F76C298|nr:NAD(P)H-binding protein [Companilactobacillus furfuricola]